MTTRALTLAALLLAALALLAAGCGGGDESEEGGGDSAPEMQTYRDDDQGFSIDLPADWALIEAGHADDGDAQDPRIENIAAPADSEVFALSPEAVEGLEDRRPAPVLTVTVVEAPGDVELDEWTEATRRSVEEDQGAQNLRDRIVSLPPGDALELTFEATGGGDVELGIRQYILRAEERQYVLTFQTDAETLESHSEDFETIADTFKVD